MLRNKDGIYAAAKTLEPNISTRESKGINDARVCF